MSTATQADEMVANWSADADPAEREVENLRRWRTRRETADPEDWPAIDMVIRRLERIVDAWLFSG